MKLLLLLTTLFLPVSAFVVALIFPIQLNTQIFFAVVDVNSVGSYFHSFSVDRTGLYQPEISPCYEDLKTEFTVNYNGVPFYGDHATKGKMAEDINADIITEKEDIRFGLVEQLTERGNLGAFTTPVERIMGYNPWLKEVTNTNATDVLMGGRGRKFSLKNKREL